MHLVRDSTPGSNQSLVSTEMKSRHSDSGGLQRGAKDMPGSGQTKKIKHKDINNLATFNVNSLLKVGKLKTLINYLREKKIIITALQETRYTDEHHFDSEGFRILKGKPGKRVAKNIPQFGTGFIVSKNIVNSIVEFKSINERLSILNIKSANKVYSIVNVHAPTNEKNRTQKEETEQFWQQISRTLDEIPPKNTTILLGDFNAQIGKERKHISIVGKFPAHERTNANGERLISLCREYNLVLKSTFFKKLPRKQTTWVSPNPICGEKQLDHVAISRQSAPEVLNVKVAKSAGLDSDHYLSTIKLKIRPTFRKKSQYQPKKFDLQKLVAENNFKKILETKTPNTWEQLQNDIIQTAEETILLKKKRKHAWWNEECDELIQKRQRAWNIWNGNKNVRNRANLIEARKCAAKGLKRVKMQQMKEHLMAIELDFKLNNTRDFYKTFKNNLRKYTPPSIQFTDPKTQNIAYSNTENCRILAEYFKELHTCDPPKDKFTFDIQNPTQPDSKPPTIGEIKEIIKQLKNNKAPGEDNIVAELWKYSSDNMISCLEKILKDIWETSSLPSEWTSALIHPLHKKGNKKDPNNYRGISLVPVTYKILSKALLNRAEGILDQQLGEYQAGFRKGRSCSEQILNLKNIIEMRKIRNLKYVVTFVDFRKAYDSLDRNTLINILRELGLDNKTTEIIEATLTNTTSKIKFMGELSDPFEIKSGVRQGDGLSPLLFNCALEKVVREWRNAIDTKGISLGRNPNKITIDCLAFADDMALITDSLENAQKQIKELQKQAAKVGLQISFEKTQFMTNISDAPQNLKIHTNTISKTNCFKYLGELITNNTKEKIAIESRIQKMERAFCMTKNTYNKKTLSWNTKLRHYQTVVRPETLYAAETLKLTRMGDLEKLEKVERRILRKILGPLQKSNTEYKLRPNRELYLKVEKLVDVMKRKRMQFYGHIYRMSNSRLTKKIFNLLNSYKSKPTWFTETQKDIENMGIKIDTIEDRTHFRKVINTAKFPERKKSRGGRVWTQDQKQRHSQRMKEVWTERKLNLLKHIQK